METKKVKQYTDHSLGFPVLLSDVTMVKFRDEWAPKLDYPRIIQKVLQVLSHLTRPLCGREVRFVRLHFGLTQAAFAEKFGVSNVAVHKWEKRGEQSTGMQWSTEKDMRLFIQSRLSSNSKAVGKLYEELTDRPSADRKGLAKTRELIAA
jgi:DNA-binding transcriptional regulator YiaG